MGSNSRLLKFGFSKPVSHDASMGRCLCVFSSLEAGGMPLAHALSFPVGLF